MPPEEYIVSAIARMLAIHPFNSIPISEPTPVVYPRILIRGFHSRYSSTVQASVGTSLELVPLFNGQDVLQSKKDFLVRDRWRTLVDVRYQTVVFAGRSTGAVKAERRSIG